MNSQEYKKLVDDIKIGKNLPDALYVHRSVFKKLNSPIVSFLNNRIGYFNLENTPWNVVKFFKREYKVSFLEYPDFFSVPFPVLKQSHIINLENSNYRTTRYNPSNNPPILHRKETLLSPDHPEISKLKQLTEQAEAFGLFKNTKIIGFKKTWEELLCKKGLRIDGYKILKKCENCSQLKIDRHKTAIDRRSLSTPVQSLYRHNYLEGSYTFFDYGCGKGDDVNILKEYGVDAYGWDPNFCPDVRLRKADIVNLGFVLNVIESPKERQQTLTRAYHFANKLLVVSIMLGSETIANNFKPYGDGVITSRNTFQKYFTQSEFRKYLSTILNESPIAVGPGLFYIFKDELEEQIFLVNRQRRKKNWGKLSYSGTSKRIQFQQIALYTKHKSLFDDFWNSCLYFGRLPLDDEFNQSIQLKSVCGSLQKAIALLSSIHGKAEYDKAGVERRNDLLVHFALSQFSQRKPYKLMPKNLQRDIKHFFGKYTNAFKEARALLFSVGKTAVIESECKKNYNITKKGLYIEGQSWTLHIEYIDKLSPILRVYIGCAAQIYGDLSNADLLKIHMRSNKVSLLRYDDFPGKPLPLLLERIKINLKEQRIDFFHYGEKFKPHPLYLKSIYIDNHFPNFKEQLNFDTNLSNYNCIDLDGYGPPYDQFLEILNKNKILIKGFKLTKIF